MRICASRVVPYRLPLRAAWRSARGGFDSRSGRLLILETDRGYRGWGDLAPLPGAGAADDRDCWHARLNGLDLKSARDWMNRAELSPAARCALDVALTDLAAQHEGVPLARLLNPNAEHVVLCNASLGVLDETAAERVHPAALAGFGVLKLKVGLDTPDREMALLRQVAERLPKGVSLRLDANRAWSMADAMKFLAGMAGLPVEMLEEPLVFPDLEQLATLQGMTEVPLALDESLPELGVDQTLAAAPVQRLVLKPMVLGGFHAALDLDRRARQAGMECVVTTTVDSAVGSWAAVHLAAALANGLHHGLATSSWLEQDVGRAPYPQGGRVALDDGAGLGFVPDAEMLR